MLSTINYKSYGLYLKNLLLFFSLICIMAFIPSCKGQKGNEKKSHKTKSYADVGTVSDFHTSAVEISTFRLPDYSQVRFISFISPTEIYVFSENSILLFDGKKFSLIYKVKRPDAILTGDCNGKYLAFSYHNIALDFYTPKLTIIQLSKNSQKPIAKIINCKVPFSNYVGSIKFINLNILFLAGFLEYGYLTLSDNNDLINFTKNFHHFAFSSRSTSLGISAGVCFDKNIKIYHYQPTKIKF